MPEKRVSEESEEDSMEEDDEEASPGCGNFLARRKRSEQSTTGLRLKLKSSDQIPSNSAVSRLHRAKMYFTYCFTLAGTTISVLEIQRIAKQLPRRAKGRMMGKDMRK